MVVEVVLLVVVVDVEVEVVEDVLVPVVVVVEVAPHSASHVTVSGYGPDTGVTGPPGYGAEQKYDGKMPTCQQNVPHSSDELHSASVA